MTLSELQEKYNVGSDAAEWDIVPDEELYELLDTNRPTWEMLKEEGVLNGNFLSEIVRNRCVTSHFFLSMFLWDSCPSGGFDAPLSESLMTRENWTHFEGLFVKKSPEKPIKDQSEIKTRMILYPRGTLKSSWDILDIIQWNLLDSTVRILVLTAADDLAESIVSEIKGYFIIREAVPTLMNLFWWEQCAEEKDLGPAGEFLNPAWVSRQIRRREPTILAKSITSTISGFHFDVAALDDAISDRNSNTDEACEVVKKRYGLTRKTLRHFGYTTILGTRYHDSDLYGLIIEQNEIGKPTVIETGICAKRIENLEKGTIILIGAAMSVKPDAVEDCIKYQVPKKDWFRKVGRDGVELLMPNPLTYDRLLPEYERDPEAFETQMRQNVTPPTQVIFTEELIERSSIHWHDLPPFGRITQTWDFSFGHRGKQHRDASVGSAVLWDDSKGVGYVIDLVRNSFPTHIDLAWAVVDFARRHHPDVICIEDAGASNFLEPTIWAEADKTGDEFVKQLVRRIRWQPVDTKADAKFLRISTIHPLLVYQRLKFLRTLPYYDKLKEEFVRVSSKSKQRNDIPDCISFQVQFVPSPTASADDKKKLEDERKRLRKDAVERAEYELLYGDNNFEYGSTFNMQEKMVDDQDLLPTKTDGLENILGSGLVG